MTNTATDLRRRLSLAVGDDVNVEPAAHGLLAVDIPFGFTDGDHFVVRLRACGNGRYEWTDLGHTRMHLSYSEDVGSTSHGQEPEPLESRLHRHGVEDRQGELVLATREEELGASLQSYAQMLVELAQPGTAPREPSE